MGSISPSSRMTVHHFRAKSSGGISGHTLARARSYGYSVCISTPGSALPDTGISTAWRRSPGWITLTVGAGIQ